MIIPSENESKIGTGPFSLLAYTERKSYMFLPAGLMIIVIMVVGKISRRVSLVRFPEPEELLQTFKTQQKSVKAALSSSLKNSSLAMSSRRKSGQSSLRHSSREKSLFTGFTETPKSSKRKHSEPSASKRASGSSDQSGKSKKKVKTEK